MTSGPSALSALIPRGATFKTDKTVYEAERAIARNLSSLLGGSLTTERFVGHARRGSVVIYRYSPFKRFGGIPGTMMFRGSIVELNGQVRLDGKFRLSPFGYIFLILWVSTVIVASAWIFYRAFTSKGLGQSVVEDAVIATIVLGVGLSFIYADLVRLQDDAKHISELVEGALNDTRGRLTGVT